jgi:hypothetical protein
MADLFWPGACTAACGSTPVLVSVDALALAPGLAVGSTATCGSTPVLVVALALALGSIEPGEQT